jgi:hypothetical protein
VPAYLVRPFLHNPQTKVPIRPWLTGSKTAPIVYQRNGEAVLCPLQANANLLSASVSFYVDQGLLEKVQDLLLYHGRERS